MSDIRKGRRKNLKIDPKKFVQAYMESDFNDQVAEKMNMGLFYVSQYATRLRKQGVKLPHRVNKGMTQDSIDEINEIIRVIEDEQTR